MTQELNTHELQPLLDRVRAANGPDRELDARIARASGYERVSEEWHIGISDWYAWEPERALLAATLTALIARASA